MIARIHVLAVVTLALAALTLTARAAPGKPASQSREKAHLVVVGKVYSLTYTRHTYDGDGVYIRYRAEVVVTAVERGVGARSGEKLNVRWTVVLRKPGRSEGGSYGHMYRMKADDIVRFWLMKDGRDWTIIDNPDGVENLTESRARLRERINVPISGEVRFGEVVMTLCNLAGARHADLVVMATHGRGTLGRFLLGSVADELVQQVALPLLLVRPGSETPDIAKEPDLHRMVIPLDGSELAERILEPAVALARLIPEAEIVLVRTILAMAADEEADVADSQTYRDAEQYLATVAARLEARGLRVRTHVVFDDKPAEAILREVEGDQAGLIALETHGRGGLSRLLYGSVADKVVRGAHVPVLVQRPGKV